MRKSDESEKQPVMNTSKMQLKDNQSLLLFFLHHSLLVSCSRISPHSSLFTHYHPPITLHSFQRAPRTSSPPIAYRSSLTLSIAGTGSSPSNTQHNHSSLSLTASLYYFSFYETFFSFFAIQVLGVNSSSLHCPTSPLF
jgi:hypothetical protein